MPSYIATTAESLTGGSASTIAIASTYSVLGSDNPLSTTISSSKAGSFLLATDIYNGNSGTGTQTWTISPVSASAVDKQNLGNFFDTSITKLSTTGTGTYSISINDGGGGGSMAAIIVQPT